MLLFLLIFLSFAQVGIFGLGGDVSAQAFLEHEVVTLHHWLTPQQFADVMAFSRALPGGTGLNASTLSAYTAAHAAWGLQGAVCATLIGTAGLVMPSMAWTAALRKIQLTESTRSLYNCVMVLLRPLTPGLMAAAAILLMKADNFSSWETSPWQFGVSIFLFVATVVGVSFYRINAVFMVFLCGIAGWLLL